MQKTWVGLHVVIMVHVCSILRDYIDTYTIMQTVLQTYMYIMIHTMSIWIGFRIKKKKTLH